MWSHRRLTRDGFDTIFRNDRRKSFPDSGTGIGSLEIVGGLGREFGIDERRIYVAGNSMGGAGVWNMLANRPDFFAVAESAVVESHPMMARGRLRHRCGTSMGTPTRWFLCPHRVTVLRHGWKASGHPIDTEYAGVDHNGATGLAFTEPALPKWVFSQRRE